MDTRGANRNKGVAYKRAYIEQYVCYLKHERENDDVGYWQCILMEKCNMMRSMLKYAARKLTA